MSATCPQCNTVYEESKKFCGKCGIPLSAGTTAISDSLHFISDADSFELDTPVVPSQSKSGIMSKTFMVHIVVVILLVLTAHFVFALVWWFNACLLIMGVLLSITLNVKKLKSK